jgi:LacI family transcriptional regulator
MAGKPTLGTVAKIAGVSIPTVSQVLRGTGRISDETRDRVLAAAKQLRYLPDSRAAAMRSGENARSALSSTSFKTPSTPR